MKSAMILAAGLGLRMRPITDTLPKPLITVGGKSMLERAFEHVRAIGISQVVVNTHHLAVLVEEKAKAIYPNALVSHENILLETGGGIKKALPLLGEGAFITLNGDCIWIGSQGLGSLKKAWNNNKMEALLLLLPREKAHGYKGRGDFFMAPDGRLSRLGEAKEAPYVYVGVQVVSPKLFQQAPEGPFSMNFLWDKALQEGRLYGHIYSGDWFHMSTPEDLKTYEPLIEKKEGCKPTPASDRSLDK